MTFKCVRMAIVIVGMVTGNVLFASAYSDAKTTYNDLTRQIKQKEAEWHKIQKANPACVLVENPTTIVNLQKKYPAKEQSKYFGPLRQVTYVRCRFYCTKCDIEHGEHNDVSSVTSNRKTRKLRSRNGAPCKVSSMQSYRRWREHCGKIQETIDCNKKIDALLADLEDLRRQADAARKEMNQAYAAEQAEKVRQRSSRK